MPQEIDGKIFYSEEEMQEKIEESKEELEEKLEEIKNAKDEDKEKLEKEAEELRTKVKGYEDKDFNFKNLRKGKEEKEKESEEFKSKLEESNKKIDQILSSTRTEALDEFLDGKIEPEDKDTKDKFDLYFKKLGGEQATTKREVLRIAQDALIVVTNDNGKTDPLEKSKGTKTHFMNKKDDNKESDASKEFKGRLGLNEKDAEKYDPKKPMPLI